jgi:hypothetical protein
LALAVSVPVSEAVDSVLVVASVAALEVVCLAAEALSAAQHGAHRHSAVFCCLVEPLPYQPPSVTTMKLLVRTTNISRQPNCLRFVWLMNLRFRSVQYFVGRFFYSITFP